MSAFKSNFRLLRTLRWLTDKVQRDPRYKHTAEFYRMLIERLKHTNPSPHPGDNEHSAEIEVTKLQNVANRTRHLKSIGRE